MPYYDTPFPVTRTSNGKVDRRPEQVMAVMTQEPQIAFVDENDFPEEVQVETIRIRDVEDYLRPDLRSWSNLVNHIPGILPQNVVEEVIGHALTEEFRGLPANEPVRVAMEQRTAVMINDLIVRGRLNPNIPRFAVNLTLDPNTFETRVSVNEALFDPFSHLSQNQEPMLWNGHIWIVDKRQKLKDQIHKQLLPNLINHKGERVRANKTDFRSAKENEIVALTLLRQMVSDEVFKKYLKYGFVTIKGASGLTYQIQRKSHLIKVWNLGNLVCTLCVYLRDQTIPPTDEVVAKMLICECDEIDIWRRANIGWRSADGFTHLNSNTIEEKHLGDLLKIAA